MPNILNNLQGAFLAPTLLSKLIQLRVLGIRCKKTCCPSNEPPSGCPPTPGKKNECPPPDECPQETSPSPCPSPPKCKLPPPQQCECSTIVTMNDLPQPCGWYVGHELHMSSIYNRYLLAGLFMMTLSIYKFQTDKMVKRYMKNYQYMCDFDYDTDYKNLSTSVELALVDVENTHHR